VRTLDVGCGSGAFTLYAAKLGSEAIGISNDRRNNEVASERAKMLRLANVQFVTTDVRELETKSELGQFDQIFCFETIEHILDDERVVRDMARLLRPDGCLLLTAPYKHYHRFLGDVLSTTEDGGHVRWGYTHPELKRIFEGAGLRVMSAEYVSGPLSQGLIRIERLLSRVHPFAAWAAVLPFRWIVVLDHLATRMTGYASLSVAVVGQRHYGRLPV
jgi:2-polyprenyl-3-methyl-5-hydroxy-6-metoxy-1,4-benzoquinol methylase